MLFVIIFAVDFSKGGHQQGSNELLFINIKTNCTHMAKTILLDKDR